MAPTSPDLGEIGVEQGGEGERGKGGGDGVFLLMAELVVERRGWSGTGQAYLCRFGGEIFLARRGHPMGRTRA